MHMKKFHETTYHYFSLSLKKGVNNFDTRVRMIKNVVAKNGSSTAVDRGNGQAGRRGGERRHFRDLRAEGADL